MAQTEHDEVHALWHEYATACIWINDEAGREEEPTRKAVLSHLSCRYEATYRYYEHLRDITEMAEWLRVTMPGLRFDVAWLRQEKIVRGTLL